MYRGIYDNIISEIIENFGLNQEQILHGLSEIEIDARTVLIYQLSLRLSDGEIVKVTGMKRSTINGIKNRAYFRIKSKWSLKPYLNRLDVDET